MARLKDGLAMILQRDLKPMVGMSFQELMVMTARLSKLLFKRQGISQISLL